MTARQLIVSGDDFGAAIEVNEGIERAHRDGILTSTSLMVGGDAAADAVDRARRLPRLAVGLHLVLAQGRSLLPPSEVPALVGPDGRFGDQPVLNGLKYAWAWCRWLGRAQLRREIDTQLRAFRATGLSLAHVDGHVNMHLHPMVLPLLVELAPEHGIQAMRLSHEPVGPALRYDRRHAARKLWEAGVFRVLSALARPQLARAGIRSTDRIFGMHQTGHVDEAYLLHLLRTLPAGSSEIYCHPAMAMAPAMTRHQPGYDPAGEVAGLTSTAVRSELDRAGIVLATYPGLARSAAVTGSAPYC